MLDSLDQRHITRCRDKVLAGGVWMRFVRKSMVLGCCALLLSFAVQGKQPPPPIATLGDLEQFIQHYHANPRLELVPSALAEVDASGIASNKNAQDPVMMAFSCIFSTGNDQQKAVWAGIINSLHDPAKSLLNAAMQHAPTAMLAAAPVSPDRNDMNWAAYFVTGDVEHVDDVIGVLRYIEERKNLLLFLAAYTAEWSLASNSRSDSTVKSRLDRVITENDPALSAAARDVEAKDPRDIQAEMIAVLKQQKQDGIWH